MGFLIPSALALTALAIPIIIFYMLKLRRQPARVSSLMLWQQVIQDRQANAPWQRLKRNLLLLLQLLILALLVMALARPYFTVQARVQGNVVLLLDTSASMQATDVSPNRFVAAREAALDLINRLNADDAVTLIAVENPPRVLAATTADRNALRHALNTTQPSNGPADWEAALTLAAANAASLPDSTIVIVSDGAVAGGVQLSLPGPVKFIPVGHSADNQGLVALSLRDGVDGPELFVRVFNAASEPARRLVEIYIDGQLFDARRLDIPARNSTGLALSGLPLDARQVQASLTGSDALPTDDVAWAVRSAVPARVLLVGEGNLFLERALALLPGVDPQRATPDQDLPQAHFDLVIFDRAVPPAPPDETSAVLPEANLLFIAPPASTSLFEVNGVITQTQLAHLETRHPLLTYAKLNNLHVARAQAIDPPPWAQTLVEAKGGPLLLAGQAGKQRVAILTFDLHQSDLPLQIDFPILMVNLIRWLLPGSGASLSQGQTLQAGQDFDLPTAPSASHFIVKTPAGKQITTPLELDKFSDTFDLGIYQVFAQEPNRDEPTLLTEFTVNLLAEDETNIQPQQLAISSATATAEEKTLTGRWEWWWGLVLLGLIILLVEWWIYWRGEVR
jgi:Ca-activated chloride channel family protein